MKNRAKTLGYKTIFNGAIATMIQTFLGHYPWFFIYNTLNSVIKDYEEFHKKVLRAASIGFISSMVSDSSTNWLKVITTTRQTIKNNDGYTVIMRNIIKEKGFFGESGFFIQY
jgi:hypothetical protein